MGHSALGFTRETPVTDRLGAKDCSLLIIPRTAAAGQQHPFFGRVGVVSAGKRRPCPQGERRGRPSQPHRARPRMVGGYGTGLKEPVLIERAGAGMET